MSGIHVFLLSRIDEDEITAHESSPGPWDYAGQGQVRWDPARVLSECYAKRVVVALHQRHDTPQEMVYGTIWACTSCGDVDDNPVEFPCPTLQALAQPYSTHPDFDPGWRVE